MLLVAVILCATLYLAMRGHATVGEYQFMIGIFLGAGYLAGFLDSRLFLNRDKSWEREQSRLLSEEESDTQHI